MLPTHKPITQARRCSKSVYFHLVVMSEVGGTAVSRGMATVVAFLGPLPFSRSKMA